MLQTWGWAVIWRMPKQGREIRSSVLAYLSGSSGASFREHKQQQLEGYEGRGGAAEQQEQQEQQRWLRTRTRDEGQRAETKLAQDGERMRGWREAAARMRTAGTDARTAAGGTATASE